MKKMFLFALLLGLLTSCGTLNIPEPPAPTDTIQPQVIDNVPGITRERLIKILAAPDDRFFVVGINQNTAPDAQNLVFIRRYFVTANGVGLDTTFAQGGQLTFTIFGTSQQIHDAVLVQEGATPRILMVGSIVPGVQRSRVPIIARVNTTGGSFTLALNDFVGEEPRTINLSNQTPARIVVGLQGTANNQVQVIRFLQGTLGNEFVLDTSFSGDGRQPITVPAPNPLGFTRLQLEDLELTPTNNIFLVGNGFQPNPLGGQTIVPFAIRINLLPFVIPITTTNIPLNRVSALSIDANNRVVLAGDRSNPQGASTLAVARLTNNLTIDTTFNNLGFNSTSFQSVFQVGVGQVPLPSQGTKLSIDAQGRIVAAGATDMFGPPVTSRAIALARFLPNGLLDASFGQAGRMVRSEGNASVVTTQSLQLFNQNRMVAGGTVSSNFVAETTLSLQRVIAP